MGLSLHLYISLNASGFLSVYTNDSNTRDVISNVTASDYWEYPESQLSLQCGNWAQNPVEEALFQGDYGTNNLTSASALALYDTGEATPCPMMSGPIGSYLFNPLFYNGTRYFTTSQSGGIFFASADYHADGYWSGSLGTAAFHQFVSGEYTALAEDEWGQVVLVHFTLTSETATTGDLPHCSTQASDILQHGLFLNATSTSPAYLCMRVYYYSNETATLTMPGSPEFGGAYRNGTQFGATSLFTISGQPANVAIGGPTNENEGMVVVYEIQPHPGVNGEYSGFIGNVGLTTFQGESGTGMGLESCAVEFTIFAGSGTPDYSQMGTCIVNEVMHTIDNPPVPEGVLYLQVFATG